MNHHRQKLRKFITRKGLFSRIPLAVNEKGIEPEITLGRAILDRALLDVLSTTEDTTITGEDWFDTYDEDFALICYVANLEPEKVVKIFERVLEQENNE